MANEICQTCGLPSELCVCTDIDGKEASISVDIEKRSHGKTVTVITFYDMLNIDLDELSSTLRKSLACGGTNTDSTIELQGDHSDRVLNVLEDENISVSVQGTSEALEV